MKKKKKKYFLSYILKLESWNESLQVETEILPIFLIFLHFCGHFLLLLLNFCYRRKTYPEIKGSEEIHTHIYICMCEDACMHFSLRCSRCLVCAISIDNLNATHTSTEDKILKDNINEDVSRFVCRSFYFVLSKKQQTHPA